MTINVGDKLPEAKFRVMTAEGPQVKTTDDIFKGKKVALFAVPGAYTGTCSTAHVPSFMRTAGKFADKGVDEILCVSVNDPFVMKAWGEATGATATGITMLGDADASFTKAIGLDFDGSGYGLATRSKRYSMIVENGKITKLNVEAKPGDVELSGYGKIQVAGKTMEEAKQAIREVLAAKALVQAAFELGHSEYYLVTVTAEGVQDLTRVPLAGKVTVLQEGRVLVEGTPEEIKNNHLVQEAYLGGVHEEMV